MNTYKIDHILKFDIAYYKKNLGENLDIIGIIVTTTRKFAVINRRDAQNRLYNVDYFGNDKTMPSCSCPDWKMLAYSCKHFFAIFKKYASWDWNWLSKLYKNSPYSALDENVKDSTEFEAQPINKNANDKIVHHQNIRHSYARGTSKQKKESKE